MAFHTLFSRNSLISDPESRALIEIAEVQAFRKVNLSHHGIFGSSTADDCFRPRQHYGIPPLLSLRVLELFQDFRSTKD